MIGKLSSILSQWRGGGRRVSTILQIFWGNLLQVVEAVRGLITTALALKYVGIEGYGWWLTFYGLTQVFAMLDMGLAGPLQRELSHQHAARNHSGFGRVLSAGILLVGAIAVLVFVLGCALIFGLSWFYGSRTMSAADLYPALVLGAAALGLGILNTLFRSAGSARLSPTSTILPTSLSRLLNLAVTFYMFRAGYGLLSIGSGLLAAEVAMLVFYMFLLGRWRFRFAFLSRMEISPWIEIARLTFFARLIGGGAAQIETSLVGLFVSAEAASLYSISRRLAQFADQALHSFWSALMSPLTNYAAQHSEQATRFLYDRAFGALSRLGIFGLTIYVLVNPWLVSIWVGPQFVSSQWLLYPLIAGSVFTTFLFDIFNETFILCGKPRVSALQRIAVGLARVVAMVAFGAQWGLAGLIAAAIISNCAGIAVAVMALRRQYGFLGRTLGRLSLVVQTGATVALLVTFIVFTATPASATSFSVAFCGGLVALAVYALSELIDLKFRKTTRVVDQ